mmetsp:Transcript_15157/g.24885  ORF Transcript_15157/g.24885 Transcript_15157/m.24885 type:complete len:414 (-) Transcript_15157:442-1683(-)
MPEVSRLPELAFRLVGMREPYTAIAALGANKVLQNALNLHFKTENRFKRPILIQDRDVVERWMHNRHHKNALQLHEYIRKCNPFLDPATLAELAWLLLGSIIPRGKLATETSFFARAFAPSRDARQHMTDYADCNELKRILRNLGPITLANDTVTYEEDVPTSLISSIDAHNAKTVKQMNVLADLLSNRLDLVYVEDLPAFDSLSELDQKQYALENVCMHKTTVQRFNESKRQQVRCIDQVKYHLASIAKLTERLHQIFKQEGPQAITEERIIQEFCITGLITSERAAMSKMFGSPVHECNHYNHHPIDCNPINTGLACNLYNQCQKLCSASKFHGCRCQTGVCVLSLAYIASQEYFESAAKAEQWNPLSQYRDQHEHFGRLRLELALDAIATCSKYYYPPPQYLIRIVFGIE